MAWSCSSASVRLSSISVSVKEKRSPARERSFCVKTSLKRGCIVHLGVYQAPES